MQEVKTLPNRDLSSSNYSWDAKLPAAAILMSEAQLPKREREPENTPKGQEIPPAKKKEGKEDFSALGTSHGFLSVGVGAAVLYIGLASGFGGLVSGISAYVARGFALMQLLNGITPEAKEKNAFTTCLDLGPSYHRGLRMSSFTSIITAVLAASQLESLGLPVLGGFLVLGTMYGFIGQKSLVQHPSHKK